MYNPDEDIIPLDLIEQARATSNMPVMYRVYFANDTGLLLAISNEDLPHYTNSVELEYSIVRDFLLGKRRLTKYKIIFIDQTTPKIIPINDIDAGISLIDEVVDTDSNSMFTISNYPALKQWGFKLHTAQKAILRQHNLSTSFEVFVVDRDNRNFLFRTIKLPLQELLDNEQVYVSHESPKETDASNITVFVKKFFETTDYRVLYDTNS
jgi:hypothetical protein